MQQDHVTGLGKHDGLEDGLGTWLFPIARVDVPANLRVEVRLEVLNRPAVEVAACAGTKFIRVRGKAEFLGEEAAAKALEIMPPLAQMVRPGKFEVFAIVDGQAVISDLMTGEAETIQL